MSFSHSSRSFQNRLRTYSIQRPSTSKVKGRNKASNKGDSDAQIFAPNPLLACPKTVTHKDLMIGEAKKTRDDKEMRDTKTGTGADTGTGTGTGTSTSTVRDIYRQRSRQACCGTKKIRWRGDTCFLTGIIACCIFPLWHACLPAPLTLEIPGIHRHRPSEQVATISRDGMLFAWSKELKFTRSFRSLKTPNQNRRDE